VVSDDETSVGEFIPAGTFVAKYPLPAGVSALSGLGIDDSTGEAWVGSRSGMVSKIGGLPCPPAP
jgi:hypothetical protein